jgi:hypothetical protein
MSALTFIQVLLIAPTAVTTISAATALGAGAPLLLLIDASPIPAAPDEDRQARVPPMSRHDRDAQLARGTCPSRRHASRFQLISAPGTRSTRSGDWNAGPALKIVTEFQSLKKYPPITPGTPDPYTPPN